MTRSSSVTGRLSLAILALATISLAFWPSWQSMGTVWWKTVTYHHGFLILPIALWLIWRQWAALRQKPVRTEPLALLPLVGFALVWLVGRAGDIQLFEHVAVVGLVVTTILVLFGRHVGWVIAFPLLFLFFMVPFGDIFVPPLQDITARFAVALLRLAGIPVFHDGFLIETPSGRFEVAEACAGIRFLIANVVVAAIFAHLSYQRWWKWVLFMALAVVIPIVANGLRAFGIILIAYLTDNEYAVGVDHLVYGWGFFTIVMLLILFVGNLFADPSPQQANPQPITTPGQPTPGLAWLAALAAIILAPPLYAHLAMQPPPIEARALPTPSPSAGWQPSMSATAWQPSITNADATATWHFTNDRGGPGIDLAIAHFAHERQGAEAVYHANRMADDEYWIRTSIDHVTVDINNLPAQLYRERLSGRYGERQLVWWWYRIDGRFTSDPIRAKLYQLTARLMGRHPPAAIIAVSAHYSERPEEATVVLESFLTAYQPVLAGYLAGLEN